MNGPIFNFSSEDIIALLQKILKLFKEVMAWLGVLVLPEEGEYDGYPTKENTETEGE